MRLVIEPLGRQIDVAEGANLLAILRDHGLPVSYSCMAGRCGTCRCKVVSGQVMEGTRTGGAGEQVLACMSTLTQDCVVEIPEPDEVVQHPARLLKASVTAIESMTHDILRLRLRASKPLAFSPGQYAQLQFTPEHIRPFSMAGLPEDDELEFHIRLVPDGRTSGFIARELRVGDSVRVTGPLGTAYLRRSHEGPMLCVAGGTGLAPILSIVRGAIAQQMANPIHLYFGVRSPADIYGLDWLRALACEHKALRLTVVVSAVNDDPSHRSGMLLDAIARDHESLFGWRTYVCGAPPMVDAVTKAVVEKGVQADHVYADAFYAAPAMPSPGPAAAQYLERHAMQT
jgi:ferredoxin-NAD(P)+ reductase (naphthalene dioxygenase ferredoxin-specific)